jgi:thiol-disulfide isomerase/thioredoxin
MRGNGVLVSSRSVLVLAVVLGFFARARAAELPLVLQDPASGASVEVAPGAHALHVVFLATWCQPCLDEIPRLADLEARWGTQGYQLVLVAIPTRQTRERVARFHDEKKPPGRLLFDADGSAGRKLGADVLPAHFVFDREGKLVLKGRSLSDAVVGAVEGLLVQDRKRRSR